MAISFVTTPILGQFHTSPQQLCPTGRGQFVARRQFASVKLVTASSWKRGSVYMNKDEQEKKEKIYVEAILPFLEKLGYVEGDIQRNVETGTGSGIQANADVVVRFNKRELFAISISTGEVESQKPKIRAWKIAMFTSVPYSCVMNAKKILVLDSFCAANSSCLTPSCVKEDAPKELLPLTESLKVTERIAFLKKENMKSLAEKVEIKNNEIRDTIRAHVRGDAERTPRPKRQPLPLRVLFAVLLVAFASQVARKVGLSGAFMALAQNIGQQIGWMTRVPALLPAPGLLQAPALLPAPALLQAPALVHPARASRSWIPLLYPIMMIFKFMN